MVDPPGAAAPGAAAPGGPPPVSPAAPAPTTPPTAAAAWPAKAVDAIDLVVDTIHDKAIRPLVLVGRAVVFGLLIAALGTLVAVALSIALIRLLDVYAFGHRVWASYALVGFVFTVAGLGAWSLRTRRSSAADAR